MGMIKFSVPGKPEPAGSKRAFVIKGTNRAIVTDANRNSRPWKDAVLAAAIIARQNRPPLDGPLQLDLTFRMLRPQGHFGSGKNARRIKDSAPAFPTGKPDTTKLIRGVEDACTSVLWRDDAQIVMQTARKIYWHEQGVDIAVATYTEPDF